MKTPPRKAATKQPSREELQGLESALTKAYARLRARALADWARRQAGKEDPADARVSVRITATSKTSIAPATKRQPTRPWWFESAARPKEKFPRQRPCSAGKATVKVHWA